MTIHNRVDEFEVECDLCGVTETFEKDMTAQYGEDNGFVAMIDRLKEDNWKIHKSEDTGEWGHLCSDCTD